MRRVMAFLAIAGALSLAACTSPPEPGHDARCATERRTIETALEAWRAEAVPAVYPTSLQELLGGYLQPEQLSLTWAYTTDGGTYTLVGWC